MSDSNVGTKTNKAPIELGFRQIIERAIRSGTTDIHFEPMERLVVVRYRRGGVLYIANKLPKQTAKPLAKYLKELTKLDTDQTNSSQTGQTILKIGRSNYHLTMSTMPLMDGEKITIHIQAENLATPNLQQLGLWGKNLSRIQFALGLPKGLILTCGMQNPQISQTIASLLNACLGRPIKTALIDDNSPPLPQSIDHFFPSAESAFSSSHYLKLLQRRGTTVIGINPIANPSTASEAVAAARTSCMIIAGVPSINVAEGLVFLNQLSKEPIGIGFGGVVLAQLNVRGLCPHCRQAYRPTVAESAKIRKVYGLHQPGASDHIHKLELEAVKHHLGSDIGLGSTDKAISQLWRARPRGCKLCDHSGYNGVVGLFEACQLSDTMAGHLIKNHSAAVIYESAVDGGMIPLAHDALVKALRGMIDLPTVLSLQSL